MAILALFEQFSGKVCSYFWPLILSASPKYDAFCTHSFDNACLRRLKHNYCYEEVQNYGKILFFQSIVENGWWGGCIPYIPSFLDPSLVTKLENI